MTAAMPAIKPTPSTRMAQPLNLPRRNSALVAAVIPHSSERVQRQERLKSWIDWPCALIMLIIATPVILCAMLLIKITSRGPTIYKQQRLGRYGKVFTIYKLRTMTHDCESLTGPRWSMPGDPRITPVGQILRILHIDELPQLINVLKGDMALVGPRPERPEICEELREYIPNYDARHVVKPGITGFAQIHLPPDTTLQSVKNKLIYDRYYIQNMSFFKDLYILGCTVLKVFHLRCLYVRKPRKPV